jgi:DNA-binding transcriptional ArsR family regulator
MAVHLLVEAQDLLRCRFALSPLWETVAAVRTLADQRRRSYHLPWVRRVRPLIDDATLAPLLALLPRTGYTPDFLTPPPSGRPATFDAELAQLAATPLAQVEEELHRCLHGPERGTAPEPELAGRLLRSPAHTVAELSSLVRLCWERLVAPQWPQLRDLLQADIALRSQQVAAGGFERLLAELHPSVQWHEDRRLEVSTPHRVVQPLAGRGLLLLPSAFVWPALTVVTEQPSQPWQPTLVYPARGVGELWRTRSRTSGPRALAQLIGRTRAGILSGLDEPLPTSTLARLHGASPSTVSGHVTALREGGLVTSYRVGRFTYHERTALGSALAGAPPGAAQRPGGSTGR